MLNNTSHPFRKKWGQNFLRDSNIIEKIISSLKPDKQDHILEVGPGDGALTHSLYSKVCKIYAVEIDPLLIQYLKEQKMPNVELYSCDILKWDFNHLPETVKIIGNLPYYISSPILFKFLEIKNWQRMVLMFQNELAQRIVSNQGIKSYGRLSVMCQVYAHVNIEFTVSRNVFYPKPNIDSAIVTFIPKEKKDLPDITYFSAFIQQAFSMRRKKLKNNLPIAYKNGMLDKLGEMRPEELSPKDYITLFERI